MSKRFIGILTVLVLSLSIFSFSSEIYAEINDFEDYDDEMDVRDFIYGDVGEDEKFADLTFKDVDKNSWYVTYVYMANFAGIMQGKSKDKFDPFGNITMAELATVAAKIHSERMVSRSEIVSKKGEEWYMPYVRYCYENGIYNDENVNKGITSLKDCQNWNRPAKRSEVAGMLARCDNFYKKGFINPDVPLTDIPDVNNNMKFSQEILILYRAGVVVGDQNMRFYPNDKVTRAEISAMVSRILYDEFKIELPKG